MEIYKVTRAGFKAYLEWDIENDILVRYTSPIIIQSNGTFHYTSKAWFSMSQPISPKTSLSELMKKINGEPVFIKNGLIETAIYCSKEYKLKRKRKGFELMEKC